MNWNNGGSNGAFPGLKSASTSLSLDLTGLGALHFIQGGPSFADFVAALSGDLSGTTAMRGTAVSGKYDAATNVFATDHLAVLLND